MTKLRRSGLFTSALAQSRKGDVEKLSLLKMACIVFVFCAATAIASPAQTFKTLVDFDGTDGASPQYASLIQGIDGDFYGTTSVGGAYGYGTVFKITAEGTLTTLYSFCAETDCMDGAHPYGTLVQTADGSFYGTTYAGGGSTNANCYQGCGTVFKIMCGKLTTLHRFNYTDGGQVYAGLVQATNGKFYGTTVIGGDGLAQGNPGGTVFEITAGGTLTTLYSFCSKPGCGDGGTPLGPLVQGSDGDLYGTTAGGVANGHGTVFKITTAGALTTLYSFCAQTGCADGYAATGGLVQATDGDFYGTTFGGGTGTGANGTVFKITPGGTLTTLYTFSCTSTGCPDGADPLGGVIQGTNGDFYGTDSGGGGAHGYGTVFEISSEGKLTTLHIFDFTDGSEPNGRLLEATNGNLYGMTYDGGTYGTSSGPGDGTVFSLAAGLAPFVEMQPSSGKVGTVVKILGSNLKGSTSVKFNGTIAAFKVGSGSEITATVPTGATTGTVEVTTTSGTLKSNVAFRVTP